MTETEEKLRTMGVTMDQRRRLMMASKLGLGPLGQMGIQPRAAPSAGASRSRSPQTSYKALPPPSGGSSSSSPYEAGNARVALAPGGHLVPASAAEALRRRQAEQAALRESISRGSGKAKTSEDDAPDLDSFLAGGKKVAAAAAKAKAQASKLTIEEAQLAKLREREAAEAALRRQREEDEKKRREEEERQQEEERKREEKRRHREEEKRRKQEERKRHRDEDDDDRDDYDDESSDDRRHSSRAAPQPGGKSLIKEIIVGDEKKRMHWGESVKGRVSSDYKGMSDAELERRFGTMSSSSPGEKLMTEQEVLAMMKKSGKKK